MKKGKAKPKSIIYVKLSALDDLCRYVCNFDYTNSSLVSVKVGNAHRIFAVGETLGNITIAYYVNTTKQESTISYTYPASDQQNENSHFVGSTGHQPNHYMNIINIAEPSFKEAKAVQERNILITRLASAPDLIIAVIKSGVNHESIPEIYSFDYRGKRILCAFDVIDELSGDTKVLYYSVANKGKGGNFARYKYTENETDFTDYMGEHSYMYAKIINLAEPFPFFKMPD